MDWKLELVTIPVSDVDRAKAFYVDQAGFVDDHDHVVNDAMRFVQLTPRGSGCSIAIGTGLTDLTPGSAQVQLVVSSRVSERCKGLTHYTLRGCFEDVNCAMPEWDFTASPPDWWPCNQ